MRGERSLRMVDVFLDTLDDTGRSRPCASGPSADPSGLLPLWGISVSTARDRFSTLCGGHQEGTGPSGGQCGLESGKCRTAPPDAHEGCGDPSGSRTRVTDVRVERIPSACAKDEHLREFVSRHSKARAHWAKASIFSARNPKKASCSPRSKVNPSAGIGCSASLSIRPFPGLG
jgi:hypothetical protein